jgi:hypothetical protein
MIIIVIIMADNPITAVIIIGLLVNILAVSAYWRQLRTYVSANVVNWGEAPDDEDVAVEQNDSAEEKIEEISKIPTLEDQNTDLYGVNQEQYDGYITAYSTCWKEAKPVILKSCSEQDYSIDSANALMAQRRARDKRCYDGWASKDADFYRHHYAEELDEEENKPWWGRAEY